MDPGCGIDRSCTREWKEETVGRVVAGERDETELLDRKGEERERGECWEANQRLP